MKHWVYFLISKGKVIYIGCTKRLSQRIREHQLNGKRFESHRAFECVNYETAHAYERRWIMKFKPRDNSNCLNPVTNKQPKVITDPNTERIYLRIGPTLKRDMNKHIRKNKVAVGSAEFIRGLIVKEIYPAQ